MKEIIGNTLLFLVLVAVGLSVGIVMDKGGFWVSVAICGIMAVLIILERKDIAGKKLGNLMLIILAAALAVTAIFFTHYFPK